MVFIVIYVLLQKLVPKWTDRHLYMGKNFDDSSVNYQPIMTSPRISQFLKTRKLSHFSVQNQPSLIKEIHIGDSYHVNRFGSGVRENCSSALFLPAEDYIVPRRFSQTSGQVSQISISIYFSNTTNSLQHVFR